MTDLDQMARDVLDRIRYVVLGTVDEDGRTRTSPVYFTPHRYEDLYWVSHPDTHHSANLVRDDRLSGVVFDSTVEPGGKQRAVYVVGRAREIPADELDVHLPVAFDPDRRGGRAFTVDELVGDADLRLYVLHVEGWDVHVGAGHPTLGTGRDRRVPIDPRP
jgi:nitroimidazol reductase NimA-like FMN-containing flavoprotein (pyridoxamine 5'-phosphate oxidase superfamily)